MIILRVKNFVEEDDRFIVPHPFPLPPGGEKFSVRYEVVGENVEKGSKPTKFMKERDERIKLGGSPWKKAYKSVMKSIKSGYIYIDGVVGERTHYYPDESTNDIYYVSKDINGNDRLMYDVHRPEIREVENGEKVVVIEIHLRYCSGHTHRDGKKFSKTE